MKSREIFTVIKHEVFPGSPLNIALTLGVMGFLAFLCQPEELLSKLHGTTRNYVDILLNKSGEREAVQKIVAEIPDDKTSDLAARLTGVVSTNTFQRAVTKRSKPHIVFYKALQEIADSYKRRS